MSKLRLYILTALLCCSSVVLKTMAAVEDTYRVSLLTCHPGNISYELYGHTALRIVNTQAGTDVTYNYGIFDFDSPNFVWRFVLGQTDYMLGTADFKYFKWLYAMQGRRVDEQVLNLTNAEAHRLSTMLEENARPEHRVYRYNFFADNCVTRPIDMIVRAIDGRVEFPPAEEGKTFRTLVNEFTSPNPWDRLGQNLLLGCDADTLIGFRQQCFAPLYAERYLMSTNIIDSTGTKRPLVKQRTTLLPQKATAETTHATPTVVFAALFFASWGIVRLRRRGWHKTFACADHAVLLAQGVMGCLLATLSLWSEHPAVSHNWSMLLFHPLALVAIPLQWWCRRTHRPNYAAYFQLACIAIYVLGVGFLRQQQALPELWFIVATLTLINFSKLKQ